MVVQFDPLFLFWLLDDDAFKSEFSHFFFDLVDFHFVVFIGVFLDDVLDYVRGSGCSLRGLPNRLHRAGAFYGLDVLFPIHALVYVADLRQGFPDQVLTLR